LGFDSFCLKYKNKCELQKIFFFDKIFGCSIMFFILKKKRGKTKTKKNKTKKRYFKKQKKNQTVT